MNFRKFIIASMAMLILGAFCMGGEIYRVTSSDGKNEITYEVKFGGGKKFEQLTAFDPASKKFVYLQWERDGTKPEPCGSIWDYKTGETIKLYKFPDVAQPLPVIPSINDLKICPKTGTKITKKELTIIFD